jgi:hypothetical protein
MADGFADKLLERVLGSPQFEADPSRGAQGQVGMTPGVVSDQMAGFGDPLCQSRLLFGEAAEQEECPTDAISGEKIE